MPDLCAFANGDIIIDDRRGVDKILTMSNRWRVIGNSRTILCSLFFFQGMLTNLENAENPKATGNDLDLRG